MPSDVKFCKFVLFALITVTIFSRGDLQNVLSIPEILKNFVVAKDPGIVRVRKIEEAMRTNKSVILNFVGMVERYDGYSAEEHSVTTKDGYNLLIHRISGSPLWTNKGKKKVAFIQHGMLCSSDSWVVFGPGKDLAFLLADLGYDVWVGNIRGNSYGRSHVNMTTYDYEFWQFSYHEIGVKDLPAMLDYVLNYTEQRSLSYIGHSMGTTSLFVLLSSMPEYNAKIKIGVCLSPATFWPRVTPQFKPVIKIIRKSLRFLEKDNIYYILPQSAGLISLAKAFCNEQAITQFICISLIFQIAGYSHPKQFNTAELPYLLTHCPAGASTKTAHHYDQNIISRDFRNYDYGVVDNLKRYKQEIPPRYDVTKATIPFALFYSITDPMVTKESVFELSNYLSNVILMEQVPIEPFSHIDFMWANDIKTLLYDRVIEVIQKYDIDEI